MDTTQHLYIFLEQMDHRAVSANLTKKVPVADGPGTKNNTCTSGWASCVVVCIL